MSHTHKSTRRRFLETTATGAAAFTIVPRHVLGRGQTPPSETLTYAVVGNGRRKDAGIGCAGDRKKIAVCDVDTKHIGGEPDNKTRYTDFRKLLERKDLTNFGAHSFDPFQWSFAKDDTAPIKAVPSAPWPQHPDAVGQFGWVELTYADGLKVVVTGGSWKGGPKYETSGQRRMLSAKDLDDTGRKMLTELPDPEPMLTFGDAVRNGKQSGGHAESSHRVCTALHLANIAIRMGRTIHFDPVKEQITGDEQANRLVNIPMRAPWHL